MKKPSPPAPQNLQAESAAALTAQLLDSEALGRLLGLGSQVPGSARCAVNERIYRRVPMPPSIQIPGSRARYWLLSTVVAWLSSYEAETGKRKRGRPRRVEQLARERLALKIESS